MAHDREVAGIRCFEVLAELSAYLDGEVDDATRAKIEAHLRGCDWCERFGGRFASTVQELKAELADPVEPSGAVRKRLAEALDDELKR